MRNIRRVTTALLIALATGCSGEGKPFDPAELAELDGLDEKAETFTGKVTVLGSLTYGRASSSVSYTRTPKYRAFKFTGSSGDKVDVWVRSSNGDAMGWLTDATFKTLASNDDATASSTDSHLTATLPAGAGATYYIVFREYSQAAARFTVSVTKGTGGGTTTPPTTTPPQSTLVGNGTAGSTTLVKILQQDRAREPSALAFHPTRTSELWIVNYADDSVVTVYNPGRSNQRAVRRLDPAAGHFMHFPTTINFGTGDTWATCGDGNNGGNMFMGPALFSSDPAIFAVATPGGLGSHLDMLHYSPYCMGMAHERANVYWAYDNYHRAVVRYDFARDHGPGADDHSDGQIRVYAAGQLRGVRGTPSHMALDSASAKLYIADTGNGRIVALDTRSGTLGGAVTDSLEPSTPRVVNGAALSVVLAPGTISRPSGLVLHQGILYVTDASTGIIHAVTTGGRVIQSLRTGLGAESLNGLTVGPEGKLYFVDRQAASVYRVDVN